MEERKGKLRGPGSRHKSLKVRNVRIWLANHYLELGLVQALGGSLGTIDISLWKVVQK